MALTEKLCPKCEQVKQASQFYAVPTRHDGLSGYCRTCQVMDAKARYNPHPRYRQPEGKKYCPKCDAVKNVEEFGNNRTAHDGKQPYCKPCSVAAVTASRHKDPTSHRESSRRWRERNLERHADNNAKRNYGIEHGTYARMLEAQGGKCAICREPPKNNKRFHVDHCHDKGHARGLLCTTCNTGIGCLKHDQHILYSAIAYLTLTG